MTNNNYHSSLDNGHIIRIEVKTQNFEIEQLFLILAWPPLLCQIGQITYTLGFCFLKLYSGANDNYNKAVVKIEVLKLFFLITSHDDGTKSFTKQYLIEIMHSFFPTFI